MIKKVVPTPTAKSQRTTQKQQTERAEVCRFLPFNCNIRQEVKQLKEIRKMQVYETDIDEGREQVRACAELMDGATMLVRETGCGGDGGLWHITKTLYDVSKRLDKMIERGGDDNEQ